MLKPNTTHGDRPILNPMHKKMFSYIFFILKKLKLSLHFQIPILKYKNTFQDNFEMTTWQCFENGM